MDRSTIKLEALESLVTDELIHDSTGTDLTDSALHGSEDAMEFTPEVLLDPAELSMNYEIYKKKDLAEPSSGTISHVIVIAPQEGNACNYETFPTNGRSYSSEQKDFNYDTSIPAIKQEIMDIVTQEGESDDVLKEEINDDKTNKGDNRVSEEYIKSEDDIDSHWVDDLDEAVKTDVQPFLMKDELAEDCLQRDLVESERIDGDSSHTYDQMSMFHPQTLQMTSSDEGSDTDESDSLSSGGTSGHKGKKKIYVSILKQQPDKNRSLVVERSKDVQEYVSSKDDRRLGNKEEVGMGEKPFACVICDKCFTQPAGLHSHMTSHQPVKPVSCPDCDKTFLYKSLLKKHSIIHTGERPYPCTLCDKSFKTRNHLKFHQRTHTEEKPYGCSMCDKSFRFQYVLVRHQKIHTGSKPFGCTMCDKTFRARQDLERHQGTHKEEKPYGCTTCDKSFKTQQAIQRHQKRHTGEKPYGCTMCDKSFTFSNGLVRHQRTHTGEKPYTCTDCEKSFSESRSLKTHKCLNMREKQLEKSVTSPSANLLGSIVTGKPTM